jgi:hypothetical protein
MGDPHLKVKVDALARNLESLLKLLGGSQADREKFWEILTGITTPAVLRLVQAEIDATAATVHSMQTTLGAMNAGAKELTAGH